VSALQIDTFTGRVGRQQDLHFRIVPEGLLRLHAFLAAHAAVDGDDRLSAAEHRADSGLQVIQCVAMLGENYQLLMRRPREFGRHGSVMGRRNIRKGVGNRHRREDLA
jgi:hypothetical protein